jgi:hypothetical protein
VVPLTGALIETAGFAVPVLILQVRLALAVP